MRENIVQYGAHCKLRCAPYHASVLDFAVNEIVQPVHQRRELRTGRASLHVHRIVADALEKPDLIQNLERGYSISKLATLSDVKQSTLDNIMRGLTKNPRVQTLHRIALAFNMTLAEFLDFTELNDYSFEDNEDE